MLASISVHFAVNSCPQYALSETVKHDSSSLFSKKEVFLLVPAAVTVLKKKNIYMLLVTKINYRRIKKKVRFTDLRGTW